MAKCQLHVDFLLPASTPVASSSERRSRIMSFIVCARRVPVRAKAMAHDRTRARGQEVGRAATNTRCSRRCTTKEVGRACHGHVLSSRRCVTTCNAEYWASCRRPRLQSYIVRSQELGDIHVACACNSGRVLLYTCYTCNSGTCYMLHVYTCNSGTCYMM